MNVGEMGEVRDDALIRATLEGDEEGVADDGAAVIRAGGRERGGGLPGVDLAVREVDRHAVGGAADREEP